MEYKIHMKSRKAESMFHETNEDAYLRVKMAYMNDKAMDLIAVADGVTHLAQGEKAAWTAVDAYLRTIQERLQGIYKEKKECCHQQVYKNRKPLDCLLRNMFPKDFD